MKRRLMSVPLGAVALSLALAGGCGGGGEAGLPGRVDEGRPAARPMSGDEAGVLAAGEAAADTGWTVAATRREPSVSPMTDLTAVRQAGHEFFDRVVFEVAGDGLPGYEIAYLDGPAVGCGSGEAVPVAGDALLAIRLEPARAHDDEGGVLIEDREREPGLPALRAMVVTCDFEGQVEWVLGTRGRRGYRVMELAGPARLVVDLRH